MNTKEKEDEHMKQTVFSAKMPGIVTDHLIRDYEFTMANKHMHPEYELYYLLKGERYYFIENETFHIHAGSLVFIKRNEIHKTGVVQNHSYHDRILVTIAPEILNPFLNAIGLCSLEQFFSGCRVVLLDEQGQIYVLQLFEKLAKEINEKKEGYKYLVKMKITELLLYAQRIRKDPHCLIGNALLESGRHKKVQEITAYICRNYRKQFSLDNLAEYFFISKSYLSRIFKDVTGVTITEYTNIQRIKYAKGLLENKHCNITRLASDAGFDSITYFERIFKKYTGLSPLEYHKSITYN